MTAAPADKISRRDGKSAEAFRTISEVANELNVPQHVLRFWETKFPAIKPLKRGGGRRYYRPQDLELLHRIRTLLYVEGYTIKGVQKLLRENGQRVVTAEGAGERAAEDCDPAPLSRRSRAELEALLGELETLRDMLRTGGS